MFIRTEETPNPSTLKFIPGVEVMKNGTMAYSKNSDFTSSPLVTKLFNLNNIEGIFLGSDFITITKSEEANWDIVKTEVIMTIMDHLVAGGEIIVSNDKLKESSSSTSTNEVTDEDSDIVKQIKELLEERVKPAVAMDGGNIIFNRFEDGIVYVELQGSCSGCPSSTATLKNGIENMLQYYVPEVVAVEAV